MVHGSPGRLGGGIGEFGPSSWEGRIGVHRRGRLGSGIGDRRPRVGGGRNWDLFPGPVGMASLVTIGGRLGMGIGNCRPAGKGKKEWGLLFPEPV
jgi:hypothetical protein